MRYGHLRPHTYDICSACYQAVMIIFQTIRVVHSNSWDIDQDLTAWNNENSYFSSSFPICPSHSADYLYDFLVTSVQSREANKFEFTKYLSVY